MHIEYVRGKIMWREVFYEGLAIVRGHHWATIDTGEPLEEVSIVDATQDETAPIAPHPHGDAGRRLVH